MSTLFAFYLCEGYPLLDLAGPMAALDAANRLLDKEHYQIELVSGGGGFVQGNGGPGFSTRSAGRVAASRRCS